MPRKILINGSTAYDILLSHNGSFSSALKNSDLEKLSVAYLTPGYARHHGGTAANIAWNVKLLSGDPLMVSAVGNDGGAYVALLEEKGISTKHVSRIESHVTATAILATDSNEQQIIFFHPGADGHAEFPNLADDREDIAYGITSPRDARMMVEGTGFCAEQKIPHLFDPGQQIFALSDDELRRLTQQSMGLVCNAFEWSVFKERLDCTEENFSLLAPLLIITQGDEGVLLINEDGVQNIPACTADKVVNPTGAGDAFRAGFLVGLEKGWSQLDACRLGAALASFVVEQAGTLLDNLDMDLLRQRAENAYGEELPNLG